MLLLDATRFRAARSPRLPPARFSACVEIPRAEFRRLRLGEHEPGDSLPPCLSWCHERIGRGGGGWTLDLPPRGDARIHFASAARAQDFLAAFAFAGVESLAA